MQQQDCRKDQCATSSLLQPQPWSQSSGLIEWYLWICNEKADLYTLYRDSPVYYLSLKPVIFHDVPTHDATSLRGCDFGAGCTHHPDIHFLCRRRSSQITQWRFSLLLLFSSGERRLAKAIACTTVSPSVNCVPEQTWFCPLLNLKKWKLDLCSSVEAVFYEQVSPCSQIYTQKNMEWLCGYSECALFVYGPV